MFQSVVLVALQVSSHAGYAPLALGSVRAYLIGQHPQLSVGTHVVSASEGLQMGLILSIHKARPDAVGFWFDGRGDGDIDGILHRLGPVLPSTVMFAFGPALNSTASATTLLRRHRGLHLAIRGEVEPPLDALAQLWQAGQHLPDAPPPQVSMIRGRSVRHGDDVPPMDDLSALPSPHLAGRSAGLEHAQIELGRGPTPWEDLHPGESEEGRKAPAVAYRSLPFKRLEAEIIHLVEEQRVPWLELVPRPADADPFLFQQILALLARHNHITQVEVGLSHLPEGPLTQSLASAGVSRVQVDLSLEGGRRGLSRETLTHIRSRAAHLRDRGVGLSVALTVGQPGQSGDALKWTVDQLLATGISGLKLRAARLPPEHPERRFAKRRGLVVAAGPPHEVLAHRKLSFEERTELLLDAELLQAFMPPWAATLRAFAKLTRQPPTELARAMARMGMGREIEGDDADRLNRRHDELLGFFATALRAQGRTDRLPVMTALARFDRWIGQADPPEELPESIEYEGDELGLVVPITSPAVSARTFPYDVIALSRGANVEDAPVRRTHILCYRLPNGVGLPRQLSEIQRRALSLVDGARPISILVEALTDTSGFEAYDYEVMYDVYAELLASGALIAAGTQSQPPAPHLRDNVLLFPGVVTPKGEAES